MASRVFISHAGFDAPKAALVAEILGKAGLGTMLDREVLKPGDSFLSFMETALTECDYCLLMWSKAASTRVWVQLEWEAALYRTIQSSQRFLIVGRIEPHPLPSLLGSRLAVDLFPEFHPGIDELIQLWHTDAQAATSSSRPVGSAVQPLRGDKDGTTIYITSDLFALTMPLCLDFRIPTGIHLDRFVSDLRLPSQLDHQGKVGIRFDYQFAYNGTRLSRSKSLESQEVKSGDVIWLEVDMQPFAGISPAKGDLETVTFRGDQDTQWADAKRHGRNKLMESISQAGLGFRGR